jgi:hypothetical protein
MTLKEINKAVSRAKKAVRLGLLGTVSAMEELSKLGISRQAASGIVAEAARGRG